jgi:hypothetical protein
VGAEYKYVFGLNVFLATWPARMDFPETRLVTTRNLFDKFAQLQEHLASRSL